MAAAFHTAGTAGSGTGTTATVSLPTYTVGDLLLASFTTGAAVASVTTPPSGWALLYDAAVTASQRFSVYYKIAVASESNPQVVYSASGAWRAGVVAYTGVDPTSPFLYMTVATSSGTTSTTATLAAAPKSGTLAVSLWGRGIDANSFNASTTGAGLSGVADRFRDAGDALEVSDATLATSGSGFTFTQSATGNTSGAQVVVVLNPDSTFANLQVASGTAVSSLALPSLVAPGTLAILAFNHSSIGGSGESLSGWTSVYSTSTLGSGWVSVYYRVLTAADVGTTLSIGSTGNTVIATLIGHSTTTPINAQNKTDYLSSGTSFGWSSLTTTTAGALLFALAFAAAAPGTATNAGALTRLAGSPYFNTGQAVDLLTAAGPIPAGASGAFSRTTTSSHAESNILLAINSAYQTPSAPTLTAPANASYADLAVGATFTWTNNLYAGDTQNAYAFRRKISGAGSYEYWNAGTGAWQSTIVWNSSSSASLTFAASKWTDGNIYNWSVATQGTLGPVGASQGPFATDSTVTASAPPAVTVTAPSGTIVTASPTVTWTETLQSGASQTAYRVVVEFGGYGTTPGSGTAFYDSGVTASTALSKSVAGLANSTTYRAFVQVTETGGQTSAWSYATFTTSFPTPATPTITAVAGTSGIGAPMVTVAVTGHDSGPTYTYANTTATVLYSDDGGTSWYIVSGGADVALTSADTVAVSDFQAPIGGARMYKAIIVGVNGSYLLRSAASSSATATATGLRPWLTLPGSSTYDMAVDVQTAGVQTAPVDVTALSPLGRSDAIVVVGQQRLRSGSYTLQTFSGAEQTQLRNLLAAHLSTGLPLLLRLTPDADDTAAGETLWLQLVNGPQVSRPTNTAHAPRRVAFDWVEQYRPLVTSTQFATQPVYGLT